MYKSTGLQVTQLVHMPDTPDNFKFIFSMSSSMTLCDFDTSFSRVKLPCDRLIVIEFGLTSYAGFIYYRDF